MEFLPGKKRWGELKNHYTTTNYSGTVIAFYSDFDKMITES